MAAQIFPPASGRGAQQRGFHVVHVRPPGYVHTEALTELAECVYFGLRRLGAPAFYRAPPDRPVRQIIIGAHLLSERGFAALPSDAILYNSEQIEPDSVWLKGAYRDALRAHPVWDYSAENVRRLRTLGIEQVRHVPLGYVPELARIAPAVEEIDVLFYGSINERRRYILDTLRARGLKVVALFGTYGEERDRSIASAKVVLNVHYHEAKIFEIVRAAYLFTNAKAVVAECDSDTSLEEDLRDAMCAIPYARLVDACSELVHDSAARQALGERAHRVFALRREEDILGRSLELAQPNPPASATAAFAAAPRLPATLHIGSGKDFRPDCFNVDIDPAWGPDGVLDIASPVLIGSSLETERFGTITLREEAFERATAFDLLEHIGDLPAAMTNVLRLLKPHGTFEILVPYDLSHGAWQDPTHVRAFNERSWLYYTDWHWYLGWIDARFDVMSIEARLSEFGNELQRANKAMDEILRTPRAVDSLFVRLRKRYLQESERSEAMKRRPGARRAQP
ncbi:MAG TPA: methyltransferase domain-containing protein [Steroidobacteraceae bacterium]|nr:methyltransferase domain-containing protein [Steroidobacteraceae bacterium]